MPTRSPGGDHTLYESAIQTPGKVCWFQWGLSDELTIGEVDDYSTTRYAIAYAGPAGRTPWDTGMTFSRQGPASNGATCI